MLSNKVSKIMSREVITAEVSSTVFDVMRQMTEKKVGAVVITEANVPTGIFTEHDVLRRVMNQKWDSRKTGIKRVMSSPIRAVSEKTHIVEALGKMYRGKFRHLLIRGEKGEMAGIVSMRDIVRLAVELGRDLPETKTIGSIMSRGVVTVGPSEKIYGVIEKMVAENTGCVVVSEKEEPGGIFTERDILKRVAIKNLDTKKTPIREVMTTNVVIKSHSTLIGDVLAEMYQRDFRNMPIRGDKGNLVGIVSMGDVLKYAKALDVDEGVRKAWKEVEEFWESEEHYTPG